jgi:hypothetical protein
MYPASTEGVSESLLNWKRVSATARAWLQREMMQKEARK